MYRFFYLTKTEKPYKGKVLTFDNYKAVKSKVLIMTIVVKKQASSDVPPITRIQPSEEITR